MLLRTAILNGIEAANEAVMALGNGSATTLTVVTIEGLIVRSYQIGDSEALVVGQRGAIKLQTTAHSPTGFAVEAGFLDQREALHHEERHLVSNFLGSPDMRIDVGAGVELQSRDTVMIASDGLMDNVHLDEIMGADSGIGQDSENFLATVGPAKPKNRMPKQKRAAPAPRHPARGYRRSA